MTTVRWVFKNGYTFDTVCEEFEGFTDERSGKIVGYSIKGATKCKPLNINFDELVAVIEVEDDVD